MITCIDFSSFPHSPTLTNLCLWNFIWSLIKSTKSWFDIFFNFWLSFLLIYLLYMWSSHFTYFHYSNDATTTTTNQANKYLQGCFFLLLKINKRTSVPNTFRKFKLKFSCLLCRNHQASKKNDIISYFKIIYKTCYWHGFNIQQYSIH